MPLQLRLAGPQRVRGDDARGAGEGAVLPLDDGRARPAHGPTRSSRPARTSGCASRASMVSRPWIVDSAPELRLTTPSAGDPVEGDAGGRVVGRGAGRVGAEEPGGHDAGEVVGHVARAAAGGDQRLHARVGAVGDLGGVGAGRQPAVVRAAGGQHPGVERERVEGRDLRASDRSPRTSAGLGERGRHLRRPGVPVGARQRPRQHAAERPGAGVAAGELGDAVGRRVSAWRAAAVSPPRCARRPRGRARPRRRRRRPGRSATPGCGGRRPGGTRPSWESTCRSIAETARSHPVGAGSRRTPGRRP